MIVPVNLFRDDIAFSAEIINLCGECAMSRVAARASNGELSVEQLNAVLNDAENNPDMVTLK